MCCIMKKCGNVQQERLNAVVSKKLLSILMALATALFLWTFFDYIYLKSSQDTEDQNLV